MLFIPTYSTLPYIGLMELTRCLLGNISCFFVLFRFLKATFSKNCFPNTIRVSNSLDPGQAQRSVYPDLGPNYLQMLSADDTRR